MLRFDDTQDGQVVSDLGTDGTYTNAANTGQTSGYGTRFDLAQTIRDGVFTSPTSPNTIHGPRGMVIQPNGDVWVVDSEQPNVPNQRIKRFRADGTQLQGAGTTGVWRDGNQPGNFRGVYSTSLVLKPDGNVVANAEIANALVQFTSDGTPVPSVLLNNVTPPEFQTAAGATDHNPNGVAVDPVTGDYYISLINFRETAYASNSRPYIWKVGADGVTNFGRIGEGRFNVTGDVMFGPFVNTVENSANYRNVFAWSQQMNAIQEFTPEGEFVREWRTGTTAAENAQQGVDALAANPQTVAVPGIQIPRGLAWDKNGYMFLTANQGQTAQGVRILAQTPRPITKLSASKLCKDGANPDYLLSWDHLENATLSVAPTEDYVVEQSTDGGTTWTVVPTAKSTDMYHLVSGVEAGVTNLRVSAWNGAGNGDWLSVDVSDRECDTLQLEKKGTYNTDAKEIQWTISADKTLSAATSTVTDPLAPAGVNPENNTRPQITATLTELTDTVD